MISAGQFSCIRKFSVIHIHKQNCITHADKLQ